MKYTPLALGAQKAALTDRYPNAACRVLRPCLRKRDGTRRKMRSAETPVLVWSGELQPKDLSRKYIVEIRYVLGDLPDIFLRQPPLEKRNGESPPHIYSFEEGKICLYYPKTDWRSDQLLSDTIVPWAAEWLFHYEIWLATGTWQGEGIHPTPTEKDRNAAQ